MARASWFPSGGPTDSDRVRTEMEMSGLPTFQEMRGSALRLLGDAEDELRSDWARAGPTPEQEKAAREAHELPLVWQALG